MKKRFFIITVLICLCLALSACQSEKNTVKQIEADRVVISHEIEYGVHDVEITIIDEETVTEIVQMHNNIQIQETSRPMAQDRFVLTFYSGEETVTTWWIALWDDGPIITAADTFGLGNYAVTNDFKYNHIRELCCYE